MIGYATVGSRNLPKALGFYDDLLGGIGMTKAFDHPSGGRVYTSPDQRWFGVLGPADGGEATVGNGSMSGFMLPTRAAVDDFHAKVLALGGTCEGKPGVRGPEEAGFYFAYMRDLDGNKLCAYRLGQE
jgi:catechol 2,3-dioxygenase-like lactoylglutathione lyase family enzyme